MTGEKFEDAYDELVENDSDRLTAYYRHTVSVFAGASDYIKYCINKRQVDKLDSESEAISRVVAISYCMEIIQAMEDWAESKTIGLLSEYGPQRYAVAEENKEKWDRIEGNTNPYIERNLNVQAKALRVRIWITTDIPEHIISDDEGWAYLNLNELEKKVVKTETGS